jgi:hypothetical protein
MGRGVDVCVGESWVYVRGHGRDSFCRYCKYKYRFNKACTINQKKKKVALSWALVVHTIILATWKLRLGGSQFEASQGK